jgi:hypothetical protein
MCYFIINLLPKNTDLEKIELIYEKYKIDFGTLYYEEEIFEKIPKYDSYYAGLHFHCDCGTSFGEAYSEEYKELSRNGLLDKKLAELIDLGSKIDENYDYEKEFWGDIPLWIGFIRESLNSEIVSSIGIILHWEGNQIVYDEIKPANTRWDRIKLSLKGRPFHYEVLPLDPKEIKKVTLNNLSEDILLHIEPEVLYIFEKE